MRIQWFSWKDVHHPLAGGAERLGHQWRRRLVAAGHEVRHVTARYPGSLASDTVDGVLTIRRGHSSLTHYPAALAHYVRESPRWADCLIEEINTVPYFVPGRGARVVLVYFQLAREIWFYQTPAPIAATGYGAEALYTRAQARRGTRVITISEDSRRDLARFGFDPAHIDVVRVGIDNPPIPELQPGAKETAFTVLFHGSLRAMKRPMDALRAFESFASSHGHGVLWISGGGDASALRRQIAASHLDDRVTLFGRIPDEQKLALMQRASVLVSTSVKEGWGLIVTEANSVGTPAIVYDVDGLRSAAGPHNWVSAATPAALATKLAEAEQLFSARARYEPWCQQVLDDSRQYNHEESFREFEVALMRAVTS